MNIDLEGSVITDKGIALIKKLLRSEGTLRLTHAFADDGLLPEDANPEEFTDVINRAAPLSILDFSGSDNGEAVMRLQATSLGVVTGYFIRGAGIFAEDPDEGEILYAYAVLQDKPLWVRPEGHAVTNLTELLITIIVDRVRDVTVNLSTSGLISLSDLNARLAPMETHYPLVTLPHQLQRYPQVMIAAIKFGAGMGGAGEAPAGGSDAIQAAARAVFHNSGSLTVYTTEALARPGTAKEVHRISSHEYIITYEGDSTGSVYIQLLTNQAVTPLPQKMKISPNLGLKIMEV